MSPPTSRRCRQTKIEGQTGRHNDIKSYRQNFTEITQIDITDSDILRQNIVDEDGLHSIAQIGRQNAQKIIQELSSETERSGKQTRPHRKR